MSVVSSLPSRLMECAAVAIDIETTQHGGSLSNPWQDRIVTLAVSDGTNAWVLTDNFEQAIPLLKNPDCTKVIQNAGFELAFFKQLWGVEAYPIHDTLLAERLLYAGDSSKRHGLDSILARRVGVVTDKSIRTTFGDGELTAEQLSYIEKDVLYLLAIRDQQMKELSSAALGRVAALEFDVVPAVVDMYLAGVGFDLALWEKYQELIRQRVNEQTRHISQFIQAPVQRGLFDGDVALTINLASVPQKLKLFKQHGIELETTRKEAIAEYIQTLPLNDKRVPLLMALLAWSKWNSMLRWKYDKEVNPVTGKIHPQWNQIEAATGRFSCSNPNLQNVPARPEPDEPDFRLLFLPEQDHVFVDADYSQQEPRIFAELCGDPAMRKACSEQDVYAGFAKAILGRLPDPDTNERWQFKTGTLAAGYGAGPNKIRQVLGIDQTTAEGFVCSVYSAFPGMRRWGDGQVTFAKQHGYVRTLYGRRRYFPDRKSMPDWKLRNEAVNSPVQGSGADMLKKAIVKLHRGLKGYRASIVIPVHDELVVTAHRDDADVVLYQTLGAMEEAGQELCPHVRVIAEGHITERWSKK